MAEGAAQPPASRLTPDMAVGCQVTLTTILDEEVRGTVFAYDQQTQCVILQQSGSHGGVTNLRLLKQTAIKEVLSAQRPSEPPDLQLPHVDIERARQREERALRQAESDLSKIGVGVTKEAQSIFDALSKTMPCRWQGKVIMVMDGVLVEAPYGPDSCTADKDHKNALERVKKVLRAERQRLGLS